MNMRLFHALKLLLLISLASGGVGTPEDEDYNEKDDLKEPRPRNLRFNPGDAADNAGGGNTDTGGNTNGGGNTGGSSGGRFSGVDAGDGVGGVNAGSTDIFAGQQIPNQFIIELSRAEGNTGKGLLYALLLANPDAKVINTYTTAFTGFAVDGIPGGALQALAAQNPDVVLSVEQNTYVQTTAVGSWGLDRIDQLSGRDGFYNPPNGLDGRGVDIYIIDTGVRSSHNEFSGRVKSGRNYANGNAGATGDGNGHGTHVASAYNEMNTHRRVLCVFRRGVSHIFTCVFLHILFCN